MKSTPWTSVVLAGGIVSAPIYETHHRGKNWAAIIQANPTSPGGIDRVWLPRGRGEFLYMVGRLDRFDAVEFGADYVTMMGNKHPKRWFGVVRVLTGNQIEIEEVGSAVTALLRSIELRAVVPALQAVAL